MARSVAEFYGDEQPPLPIGVVADEPDGADASCPVALPEPLRGEV
jgi:hypothetical protein